MLSKSKLFPTLARKQNQLKDYFAEEISKKGSISLAEFMK